MIKYWDKKTNTSILVFYTKPGRFRAKVKEGESPTYEVTIGGKEWCSGKGRRHTETIRGLIQRLRTMVEREAVLIDRLLEDETNA